MPKSEITNVLNDRVVLGVAGSVIFFLILWIMNSFRNQVKKLFDRTEDQGIKIAAIEATCKERKK